MVAKNTPVHDALVTFMTEPADHGRGANVLWIGRKMAVIDRMLRENAVTVG